MASRDSIYFDYREYTMSGLSSGVREEKARGIWSEVEEGESDCMLYSYIFRIIFSAGCNRICFHGAAYSIFGYYEESCGVDYDRYAAVEFCAGVYYLQPVLQKRFGARKGVLILGAVWGIWHLPLDFFFYVTPDKGVIMTINQIITCVGIGIFMGYVYMKTENIWAPVIVHFLNNNLALVISGEFSADALMNQSVTWGDIPIALLTNGLLFGLFLFAKQYREKPAVQ